MVKWPWPRRILAALVGAGAMVAIGQGLALLGGSCTIVCRPPIAASYGAIVGLLVLGSPRRG
jgi:hypothetical protein